MKQALSAAWLALGLFALAPQAQAQVTSEVAAENQAPAQQPVSTPTPAKPRKRKPPDAIEFGNEPIIDVTIQGLALRLKVRPGHAGPPIINRAIAEQLTLYDASPRSIDFGSTLLPGAAADTQIDFGYGPVKRRVAWSARDADSMVDGVIGVHDLPYKQVTFRLSEPNPAHTVQSFPLKRRVGRDFTRLGTEVKVDKKRLFLIFALHLEPNVITGGTANFLATSLDAGFVADSDGFIQLMFDITLPTRDMQTVFPIELGDLDINRFAVRIEDHGRPDEVGEIEKDDPRFTQDGGILVSSRKRRGKPDLLTRIGRQQLAHCSQLRFDLKARRIDLTCGRLEQPEP